MKYFIDVINLKSILVILAACISTMLCKHFNFHFDVPTELIGIAIVFPIVFSINAAYSRREQALKHYASMKSLAFSIKLAHSHWPQENNVEKVKNLDIIYSKLFNDMFEYLKSKSPKSETYHNIMSHFKEIAISIENLRKLGVFPPELVKMNDHLRMLIIDFENIINIKNYRTPNSLRSYTKVFLNFFPIIFGPFFAHVAAIKTLPFGIILAIIYALVLTSLDNIQEDLEDPFDGIGSDDINLSFPYMLEADTLSSNNKKK